MNEPLDLDRLESLAHAATPGPWRWEDPDTDLPCLPDAPCAAGDHDKHAYSFSLRTVAEFPSNVGPLPRFIISRADEFHEVERDGAWTHPDAEFIAALSPEIVLALIAAARDALGVPRPTTWLSDEEALRALQSELVYAHDRPELSAKINDQIAKLRVRMAEQQVVGPAAEQPEEQQHDQ